MSLLREKGAITKVIRAKKKINMKLVDATHVKEPGKTGSLWRLHYSLKLPELQCNYFKLTGVTGEETEESFKQFPVEKDDCIIGDRGYSTAQGIAYLDQQGAYSLVRINTNAINFYTLRGAKLNLLSKASKLNTKGLLGHWNVKIQATQNNWVEGRLCVIRKSQTAIEQALKKLKSNASKKQTVLKPETIEFAKYAIVFTTLLQGAFSVKEVLECYRLRWQIELIFKRLKSLAGLGHLPKYDEGSARAWLYGKLFVGLMVEKLIRYANNISPWGYSF